jgi:diketogulonate reductase-like aldo/keto reductase
VWRAIEALYESGKARIIGISNVSADQLNQLCAQATHKPMVVQNRCYAAFGWDKDVRAICHSHHIVYQAFSLLTANRVVFVDPAIRAIAARLGTGVAQVIFRFAMQVGMLPLTGTTSVQHMKEDLQAEQLELTAADLRQIDTIGL